jgi:hypothetical protein
LNAVERAIMIDEKVKEKFRERKTLLALLRACGSDRTRIDRLRKMVEVPPVTKETFCKFLEEFDLVDYHNFIEWIAVKRHSAAGEGGMFIIKIDPPYDVKGRLVSASALSIETWQPETIVSNTEPVTIDKLFDAIHPSFILFYPTQ